MGVAPGPPHPHSTRVDAPIRGQHVDSPLFFRSLIRVDLGRYGSELAETHVKLYK